MNCKTAALARDEPWRIGFIGRPDPAKTPCHGRGGERVLEIRKNEQTQKRRRPRVARGGRVARRPNGRG